jgi:hypothetical protein
MPKQHTSSAPFPQDNPNLSSSADNTSIRRERARRKFQFLAAVKFTLSTDRGRKTCEVSHRLLADLADEIVTGPYPSLATFAPIYAGQWADRSRETGAFEVLEQRTVARRKGAAETF